MFSEGKSSAEGVIKRYIGVAPVRVVAVNPTRKELEEIYGRTYDNDPEYLGTMTTQDGKEVKTARVVFILRTDPEKCNGIDILLRAQYTIINSPWKSKDGKFQIIDEFGRSGWALDSEIKSKAIPVYKNNQKANISVNYRMAYRGESALTDFIKDLLNTPSPQKYNKSTGEWTQLSNTKDCEARFELNDIKAFFTNKFDCLREIIKLQPNNVLKVAVGVRRTDDGKLYQEVYTRKTLRNGATTYDALAKDVASAKEAGSYASTDFSMELIHEYDPAPTTFAPAEVAEVAETNVASETEFPAYAAVAEMPMDVPSPDMPDYFGM